MVDHVLFATSAFVIVSVAALQAVLLAVQDYLLRHGIINKLPPLEVMERLLFQMIGIGWCLLTWVLVSSVYSFDFLYSLPLLPKLLLTLACWLVFTVLLSGRHVFGWRGRKVTYGTLIGFFLLIIIYLGSQFTMELLL